MQKRKSQETIYKSPNVILCMFNASDELEQVINDRQNLIDASVAVLISFNNILNYLYGIL